MQQRRPHSSVADGNGIAEPSRDQRRLERRLAKERRAAVSATGGGAQKRLRRVKRSDKYNRSAWASAADKHLRMAFIASFALFGFVGVTVFRMLRGGDVASSGRGGTAHWRPRPRRAEGEYNSDSIHRNAEPGLFGRLRGNKYSIPESMTRIGNKKMWYAELRREYDTDVLPKDDERSIKFVEEERERQGVYAQSPKASTPYDVHDCPDSPPKGYPVQWNVLEVLENWPTDDSDPQRHRGIYQGICIFDYRTELDKAEKYRRREVPFIMRNDPAVARAAERWNHPGYMERLLMGKEDTMRRTEYSPNNHFMYWVDKRDKKERKRAQKKIEEEGREGMHNGFGRGDQRDMAEAMKGLEKFDELRDRLAAAEDYLEDHEDDDEAQGAVEVLRRLVHEAKQRRFEETLANWKPPTENLRMTYTEWLGHANVTDDQLGPDNPHWYFRLIGCGDMGENTADGSCDKGSSEWLFDELTFFQPRMGKDQSFYLVEPEKQKG